MGLVWNLWVAGEERIAFPWRQAFLVRLGLTNQVPMERLSFLTAWDSFAESSPRVKN